MPKTEAWWVCARCNKPIAKTGKKKKVKQQMDQHGKVCERAGYWIQQVVQQKFGSVV